MKIGFISTMEGCPWGGSELLWSQTADRMARAGFEVGVCVRHWPETPKHVQHLAALWVSAIHPTAPDPAPAGHREAWSRAEP